MLKKYLMTPKLMIKPASSIRLLGLALLYFAALTLVLPACNASTETKQGARGEYCKNRDDDCREGLVCADQVCVALNSLVDQACQRSCEKISSCGLEDIDCISECAETIKDWSEPVIDKFSGCIADELDCEELGASDNEAAQICYDRLELKPERLLQCRELRNALLDCNDDYDPAEFEQRCLRMARTTDEETWSKTDTCAQTDQCSDTNECVHEVFGLSGAAPAAP